MRSSTGAYYAGLDHVRAFAVLLVFTFHFLTHLPAYPFPAPAVFPLALFLEGHVGVSLFMVLSGYLFAKLLDGRRAVYRTFLWNRLVRLAPLLLVVIGIYGLEAIRQGVLLRYLGSLAKGLILPLWPSGGWSVVVEMQFYFVLPILIWVARKSSLGLIAVVLAAIALREGLFALEGSVRFWSYSTIVGRIDQFALGIAAFHLRRHVAGRHAVMAGVATVFMGAYWWFAHGGGFYGAEDSPIWPNNPIWIVLPTIEAVAFAVAIAYYDTTFTFQGGRLSAAIAKVGELSYSIYLLHLAVVIRLAQLIDRHVVPLSNFYAGVAAAFICFALFIPVAWLSNAVVEKPFLRYRRPYIATDGTHSVPAGVPVEPIATALPRP